MDKKEKTKVCCDVCSCAYNENGCECNKQSIKISKDEKNEDAHYCKSYECKCGFKK